MKRFFAMILALMLLQSCAMAKELTGQRYQTFVDHYTENINFLNENTGRHMMPLVIASRENDVRDGRMIYEIFGDVITLMVQTDKTGEIIEICEITLTAPSGMSYGDAAYADFQISGFHSHALLMAMHTGAQAYDRYGLVTDVEEGLKAGDSFIKQVGVYELGCTRNQNKVILSFVNSGLFEEIMPDNDQINQVQSDPIPDEDTNSLAG